MKNPIMPFILIMVLGIGLMFMLSFKGLGDAKKVAEGDKEGGAGEKTEQTAATPEEIYQANCLGCHGGSYEGGMGPALKGVGDKKSEDEIKTIIKDGKNAMPDGLVPEEKLDEMTKWLSEL